jgi:glucose dehydrogenase
MRLSAAGASLAAWLGATLSSLCCLLPLAVIVLGLGSGAFMAVTMQYRWILIPTGALGVAAGFALYARERRRCARLACHMAGSRLTLALLIVAAVVVSAAVALDQLPELTADLIAWASGDLPAGDHSTHGRKGM